MILHTINSPAIIPPPFSISSTQSQLPKPIQLSFHNHQNYHCSQPQEHLTTPTGGGHRRRSIALGLVGIVMGLSMGEEKANAAARRAAPTPPATPQEKKDPNVNGVVAKVLASKKRKEAMKESIAKLRDKGKQITT